jgi:cytochrome P450
MARAERPLLHQVEVDAATDEARRALFPAGAALTFADLEQPGREPVLDALRAAGPHACLGLHVARLETRIALEEILDGLPGLRLVDHAPPGGFAFRRPAAMVLAWDR